VLSVRSLLDRPGADPDRCHGPGPLTAVSAARGLALLALAATVAVAAWLLLSSGWRSWASLRTRPAGSFAPDALLGVLARLGTGVLLGWLALTTALALVAAVPSALGDRAARLTPLLMRSVVAAAVSGSIAVSSAAAATATSGPSSGPRPTASASVSPAVTDLPDPGWTPAPPPPPPPPPTTRPGDVSLVSSAGTPGAAAEEHVVVRRGDTLWAITARHLGPDADAAEIAREWPRWYAANRALIGADPDLLQPGQRLTPPSDR
jgi:nucleoid-associated protein YgaU